MKIDLHYQRRKCSVETPLCEDIRVMPIFVGVRWIGASNERGSSKIVIFASCGRYTFSKFNSIMSEYVVPQWVFIDIETDDLE